MSGGAEARAPAPAAWCFAFRGAELLVVDAEPLVGLPRHADLPGLAPGAAHHVGVLAEIDCWAIGVADEADVPEGMAFAGLRELFGRLDDHAFALAGRALQLVEWERTHRFCGRCGTPTEPARGERAMACPACGLLAFPRVAPAIIVRVTRGDEILLAHGRRFPSTIYSVLAGFVDPGESLEECVHREVREEVGIEIANLRYFASQPWPFPHSLMVGFTAEWAGGELDPDPEEIADAGWFRAAVLPELPPKISIARRLIDDWLGPGSSR